jgi:hypothetical protein
MLEIIRCLFLSIEANPRFEVLFAFADANPPLLAIILFLSLSIEAKPLVAVPPLPSLALILRLFSSPQFLHRQRLKQYYAIQRPQADGAFLRSFIYENGEITALTSGILDGDIKRIGTH